jgi:hypothetical protein
MIEKGNVEAIYPLSPMQEAVLLHSLRGGEADDGFLQLRWELRGRLRVSAFQAAWERVVERHSALRASVHWRDVAKPLQVVRKKARLIWRIEDWRGLPAADRDARLATFLREDRVRGLDLGQAPPMRFALLQIEEEAFWFVWSCHHIFQDGWSGSLAFREGLAFYEAALSGEQPDVQSPGQYRDFVAWLKRQDVDRSAAFWKTFLGGTQGPVPLNLPAPGDGGSGSFERTATLDPELARSVADFARENRLTLSTVLQGALASLLAIYCGENDVVFGTTVSGRPPEVQDSERMVGLLTNILPVRVIFVDEVPLASWLEQLQERGATLRSHEHTPISRVQEWSGLSPRRPLFETLFVFENYGWEGSTRAHPEGLRVGSFCGALASSVPMTLSCSPEPRFALTLLVDTSRYPMSAAEKVLDDLERLLEAFVERPDRPLRELRGVVTPAARAGSGEASREVQVTAPRHDRGVDDDFVQPRTPTETLVARLWAEALGFGEISVYDNFFDLGGTSLLSLSTVEQLERACGIQINPGELVYQTLGQLAASLDERRAGLPDKAPEPAPRRGGSLLRLLGYGGVRRD